ncbi:MAG: ankyrin repeat domain-containing protein [Planctomycetota bacterium]|jgi:pectate lyase
MNRASIGYAVFLVVLAAHVPTPTWAEADNPDKYLNAVREFADNVLKYGRDTYGPEHTPLFVDGLNKDTLEPVTWIAPNGDRWFLSNLASQQNLFRVLDGLTTITGDPKYRQAAVEAIEYAFANLRTPSGLLYWGGCTAYDAKADKVCGQSEWHALKGHYPYYKLMWDVDPGATKQFIESFWSAHVKDWSNLAMDRITRSDVPIDKAWKHEHEGGPVFLESGSGLSFINAGTDLVCAAAWLTKLSGDREPLVWGRRLARRYVETRHPKTGISCYMYTKPSVKVKEWYDDVMRKFVPGTTDAPLIDYFPWNLNPIARVRVTGQVMPTPGISVYNHVFYWQSLFLVGMMLDGEGDEFKQWASEELTAFGKASYRKKDNAYVPILTDGTNLEGYVIKEDGLLGPKGILEPVPVKNAVLWAYAMGYRLTEDEFMWEMAHGIAKGNEFGDIGATPERRSQLKTDTECLDPYVLLAFLELYKATGKKGLLEMAERIGDNILGSRFHKGFFVASNRHIWAKFDAIEALVLLHLHSACVREPIVIPRAWPSVPCFLYRYRNQEQRTDNILYTLTESTELPLSFHEAATIGDINLVNSFLEKGVGVDSWGEVGMRTALQCAAMGGHKDIVELLLAKGARIDIQEDFPGGTALDYAAEKGHKEVVELLIAKGADVSAKRTGYPAGNTPLHSAVRTGHKDIIELLGDKGADVNAKNDDGQTPLDIALSRNRKEIVQLLLAKGATISSIHVASQVGDFDTVKALLEQGADVNAQDGKGIRPLHYAIQAGHKELAELLIASGADINSKNKGGYTSLYYAVWNRDTDMVKFLVTKGADIHLAPEGGYSLLNFAVWGGNKDIVELLVAHGARSDVEDQGGWTAFRYAASQGSFELIELFVAKGADVSSFHMAACVGDLARVEDFVEEGTDVDAKDKIGWTPLYWAASTGQTEAAEFLIANGADVNAKEDGNVTPLHQAAQVGGQKLAELLISKGAEVDAKTKLGRTPLHIAAMMGRRDVAEFLLTKDADVAAKDNRDRTACDWAEQRGHTVIVELLKKHGAKE